MIENSHVPQWQTICQKLCGWWNYCHCWHVGPLPGCAIFGRNSASPISFDWIFSCKKVILFINGDYFSKSLSCKKVLMFPQFQTWKWHPYYMLIGAGRPSDAANEGWKTFSAATWNQICQICCVLHVRIHVQLVGIPWLLPGISCWTHKGTFCISCAFHGRHHYFTIHFNTKWSVFRHDGQACFRGSSKRSSSLVVWCLKAIWCWLSVGSSSMLFNQFIHCFAWSSHTVSGRQVFMVFFAPLSLDLENHAKRCSPSFICKPIRWHH